MKTFAKYADIKFNNNITKKQEDNKIKINIKLTGKNGNIFNLIAKVSNKLKKNGLYKKNVKMLDEVRMSKNYDEALDIISKYVKLL